LGATRAEIVHGLFHVKHAGTGGLLVKFFQAFLSRKSFFCQVFPKIPLAILGVFKGLAGKNLTFDEDRFSSSF
jgi:hypothetical protein